MEISLNRRSMNCFKKSAELAVSCETMAECVVPDVQEDIRQVLTTSFITKIRSKDIDIDEICIKAEVNAVVVYYSENGIEKLEMNLPVNAKIPARDIDSSCIINADIRVAAWDVRIINPRKASLKADVCVKASCYRENELVWYDVDDELPKKMFVKSDDATLRILDTVAEKAITAEEEFDLIVSTEVKLISACAKYSTESSEAVGDKLIVRCRADIETVYLSEGKLMSGVFSIPFSQLFDVDGEGAGDCEATILSTGEYYDLVDGKLNAEIHAIIQLVYYKSIEISFASDAYSCCCETQLQYEEMECLFESNTVSMKDTVQLSFDAQRDVSELLMTKAYITKTECSDDGIIATVAAELIYKDSENELFCGKIRGNLEFPLENSSRYRIQQSELAGIRAVATGNSIDFKGEVRLSARIDEYGTVRCISAIEEGEAFSADSTSAYVVFSDEDTWNIAKKYRSSCTKISEITSGGNEKSNCKKLFVPVIK